MENTQETINPQDWLNNEINKEDEKMENKIENEWKNWAEDNFNTESIEEADFNISNLLAKQRQQENPIILDFN